MIDTSPTPDFDSPDVFMAARRHLPDAARQIMGRFAASREILHSSSARLAVLQVLVEAGVTHIPDQDRYELTNLAKEVSDSF